jgi:maleylpyruvate isomerase
MIILHGYWRSGTSYRSRIALNLKNINYVQKCYDLSSGEHKDRKYRNLHPQGLVPAIQVNGQVFTQSPAILEWLEEQFPVPPLLPAGLAERAQVRAMAALISCDIHPLNNLRVLNALRDTFGASSAQLNQWAAQWMREGFDALEKLVTRFGEAFGSFPTIADCHLVPQIYSAERFKVDLSEYPRMVAAAEEARKHPAFAAAHPDLQPDAQL